MKTGGYAFLGPDGRADVELVGMACARLINDLFLAKQKLVNAIRRQRMVLGQYESFGTQYDARAREIQKQVSCSSLVRFSPLSPVAKKYKSSPIYRIGAPAFRQQSFVRLRSSSVNLVRLR